MLGAKPGLDLSQGVAALWRRWERLEPRPPQGLRRHSYALLPIGYPMGRFGPVRRVALSDVVYENRWGQTCHDV